MSGSTTSLKANNGYYWRVDPIGKMVSPNGTVTDDPYCRFTIAGSSIFSVGASFYVGPGQGNQSAYLYATYQNAYAMGNMSGTVDNEANWITIQFQLPNYQFVVCDGNAIKIEDDMNMDPRTVFQCDPPFPS
ncbi:hypothetical protein [Bordetella sp. H567]|uniref:hypothetical protein n=1 Tax=Bordetella sp. H567 TaxID=1697043 RepID=UPI0011AB58DA|nr:hypothetical protein [Bordetella sp. H567]